MRVPICEQSVVSRGSRTRWSRSLGHHAAAIVAGVVLVAVGLGALASVRTDGPADRIPGTRKIHPGRSPGRQGPHAPPGPPTLGQVVVALAGEGKLQEAEWLLRRAGARGPADR